MCTLEHRNDKRDSGINFDAQSTIYNRSAFSTTMKNYNLELDKAVDEIKKNNAKLVCLQLPDGLKPQANTIQQHLEKETSASIIIWMGSCWGGCDIPLSIQKLNVDLLIQWGHSVYIRSW